MKRKIVAVCSILIGLFSLVYLILQNVGVSATAFGEVQKTKEVIQLIMTVFAYGLALFAVILLILAIKIFLERKKEGNHYIGEAITAGGLVIALIGLLGMGSPTILSPICILGGIMMLIK